MGDNEIFSSYTKLEQRELIKYIKNYKLEMQDRLKLPKNLKFGIEIEAESQAIFEMLFDETLNKDILDKTPIMHCETYFNQSKNLEYDYQTGPWILKPDTSVTFGGEVHSPILTDNIKTWKELKKICEFFRQIESKPTNKTALHTHFSKKELEDVYQLYNLIKLYVAYENVLYYFGTGEFINFRDLTYAQPMAAEVKAKLRKIHLYNLEYKTLLKKLEFTRFRGLRLTNLLESDQKNTIEFRFANSTLIPAIIQNTVNVCGSLVQYALSDNFDDDFVTRRYNHINLPQTKSKIIDEYSNPPLEDLLEFADLIFENTTDKLNFLRQCIKSPINQKNSFQKAKKFY